MTLTNLDLPFLGEDCQAEIKLMAQPTSQCSWKNNLPLQNRHRSKTEKKNNFLPPTKGTSWKSKQENKGQLPIKCASFCSILIICSTNKFESKFSFIE